MNGLISGPYASATKAKLEELQGVGITHIVCVRESRERSWIRPNHPEAFQYLVVEVEGMKHHYNSLYLFVS